MGVVVKNLNECSRSFLIWYRWKQKSYPTKANTGQGHLRVNKLFISPSVRGL